MHKITIPVTVVIPCFCCSDTINRAVDSVISQTAIPSELILVDDASNDGGKTKHELERIRDSHQIPDRLKISLIFLPKNSGPGVARNAGWDHASADYVAFLDADDAWHLQKLEMQYHWMISNPGVDASAHQSYLFNGQENSNAEKFMAMPILFKRMLFSNFVQTRTVMLKKSLTYRFDTSMRYAEDYELWMRMISNEVNFYLSRNSLAYTFREEYSCGGLSASLLRMEQAELKVIRQQYLNGKVKMILFGCAYCWSLIRFSRRLFKRFLTKLVSILS